MTNENLLEKLSTLLKAELTIECPVLSGNMKNGIRIASVKDNEIVIEIEAKFYDMNEYRKSKAIKYTGANYDGITDYAMLVNSEGAFSKGTHKHWATNTAIKVCQIIASENEAEFKNNLNGGK